MSKLAVCLVAVLLTLSSAACADETAGDGGRPLLGKQANRRDGRPEGRSGDRGADRQESPGTDAAGSRSDDRNEAAPDGEVGDAAANQGPGATDPSVARGSARISDSNGDGEKSGVVPEYGDIVAASVDGLGDDVRATMTFAGELPESMPNDKTYMVLGIAFTGQNESDGYAFGAQASNKGWKPYGGDKSGRERFPGSLSITGNRAVFTLPWSALGGARPFRWHTSSSWFQSLAGTTHYIFDAAPNEGLAKYPAS